MDPSLKRGVRGWGSQEMISCSEGRCKKNFVTFLFQFSSYLQYCPLTDFEMFQLCFARQVILWKTAVNAVFEVFL